jgi:hypothetical protein
VSILKHFGRLKDPRRAHRRLHLLSDIVAIALCAVIAGAQDWQEVETFGRKRRARLERFLSLPNGVPRTTPSSGSLTGSTRAPSRRASAAGWTRCSRR